VGVHIAAPGLAIQTGTPLDQLARTRLSTVYMPGHKITMLPDDVVQAYTLLEGRDCPAVSLYVQYDEATLAVKESETRLERVPIAVNLRHDQLDEHLPAAFLDDLSAPAEGVPAPALRFRAELSFLFRLAKQLKAQREVLRGKPETFNRPDYNFRVPDAGEQGPEGSETVEITVRKRGAPLDLIVAEAMILANSTWGLWLAELGVPGIYRSQASLAPGMKVRMGTKAAPHAGIGVKCYAWSTSPLRRYTDLVNQWQIIAAARHGRTAALAAPFKPKDADLFSIISSFDGASTAYNGYQAGMERFWTLRYLHQHDVKELVGTVFREGLVRADDLPLVLPVLGAEGLPRGSQVRVRLGATDEISLEVTGTVVERIEAAAPVSAEDDSEEEEPVAGPIAIAVDVTEGDELDNAADNPPS
jgi:exoribonuclease-2